MQEQSEASSVGRAGCRRPRPEDRHAPSAGFTLLEVLVAMTLTATIMVALFGMFRTVMDTAAGARKVMGADREARTLIRVFDDDFRSVCLDRAENKFIGRESEVGLDGEAFLTFTTASSLAFGERYPSLSLQRVEYVLRRNKDGEGFFLMRRERPYWGVPGDFDWREYPLSSRLADFSAMYMDSQFRTFEREWNPGGQELAPPSVRFAFSLMNDPGREYEIVVPVR